MLQQPTLQSKKPRGKFFAFWLIIFCLIACYVAIWFLMSHFIIGRLNQHMASSQDQSWQLSCAHMSKAGFPLRIGLSCQDLSVKSPPQNFSLTTPGIEATTPVYNLNALNVQFNEYARILYPGLAPIQAQFDQFNLYKNLKTSPFDFELALKGLGLHFEEIDGTTFIEFLRFVMKPQGGQYQLGLHFDQMQLPRFMKDEQGVLAPFDGDASVNLTPAYDGAYQPASLAIGRLQGAKGVVNGAKISFANGSGLALAGPFSFDEAGLLNAKFNLSITNATALGAILRDLLPGQSNNIQSILFILNVFQRNEKGEPQIPLTIEAGTVRIGFLQIGHIRALP